MKISRFTEVQVAYALRQAEAGMAVMDVCRSLGISEATFYIWKKKYGDLGATEVRWLRFLFPLSLWRRLCEWKNEASHCCNVNQGSLTRRSVGLPTRSWNYSKGNL